jgi:hypothetical protein
MDIALLPTFHKLIALVQLQPQLNVQKLVLYNVFKITSLLGNCVATPQECGNCTMCPQNPYICAQNMQDCCPDDRLWCGSTQTCEYIWDGCCPMNFTVYCEDDSLERRCAKNIEECGTNSLSIELIFKVIVYIVQTPKHVDHLIQMAMVVVLTIIMGTTFVIRPKLALQMNLHVLALLPEIL